MKIVEELQRMRLQDPIEGAEYYSISLFSSDGKTLSYSVISSFVGFTETKPIQEIRQACKVYPKRMMNLYNEINESALMINNDLDRKIFFWHGGHGIIESKIAGRYFSKFLEPDVTVKSLDSNLNIAGYTNVKNIEPQKLKKAPYPKLRMKVLKRDNYKCKICGRSPDNYSDIELHIHHIRPFSKFGLTELENLITLCHTCHNGLEPHFEWNLFSLIGENGIVPKSFFNHNIKESYSGQVKNYQRLIKHKMKTISNRVDGSTSGR